MSTERNRTPPRWIPPNAGVRGPGGPELFAVPDPYRRSAGVDGSAPRRMRPTRHRIVLAEDVVTRLVARLESQAPEGAGEVVAARLAERGKQRGELRRMQARRKRMAALVRGVRDPERHGALRHAILRLDASIIALQRALRPAA